MSPRGKRDIGGVSLALHRTQQAGFAHELVKETLLLHERLRSVELLDLALVEYNNAVAVKDSVDAMRD